VSVLICKSMFVNVKRHCWHYYNPQKYLVCVFGLTLSHSDFFTTCSPRGLGLSKIMFTYLTHLPLCR
jgi:hypothetical protein